MSASPDFAPVGMTCSVGSASAVIVRGRQDTDMGRARPRRVGRNKCAGSRGPAWPAPVHWLRALCLLASLCLVMTACGNPVSAKRVDSKLVQEDLGRSAVTTGEPSWASRNVLFEQGLFETYGETPEAALAQLHRAMIEASGDPDLLFALAELSFLHGQAAAKREYQLAAAVYAYAFLFPEGVGVAPGRFDPRLRLAADVYNLALAGGLASEDGSEVQPRGGIFALPFGSMEVAFDAARTRVGQREMYAFVPAAELKVEGLAMRYRWPGLGAPLAASTRPLDPSQPAHDLVAPRLKIPVTALLRVPAAREGLIQGRTVQATLDLHPAWEAETVTIAGERVPVENEPTAALAYTFSGIPIIELEMFGFLGRFAGFERPPLISATPYRPGLIPVVFVHGTESSVVRWAEMVNRLQADPEIRGRYQFWFFQYDSGNPVALSSLGLRQAVTATLDRLDPERRDPALRRMVLIGHSQGGLLVKMQAISSGERLWNGVASKPLAELTLTASTRDLLRHGMFVEPLPEVSRVIFICTPHRGSFVAGRRFIADLVRRLVTLPVALTGIQGEIMRNRDAVRGLPVVPSAVDNMSPGNHFILALQEIPVVPAIIAHSIIAVEGDGPVEKLNDGVVEYTSAHISEAQSEYVVRPSSHSTQGNPKTIQEVRRILRLHAVAP